MLKSFKTEINPTEEQKKIINKTIGVCRFVYNFYLDYNKQLYQSNKKFMTGKDFSVWLNNKYLPNHSDKQWIKEVSSKSVKQSIENGYKAFQKFFKKQSQYPKFKKKNKSDVKMYFVKTDTKSVIQCERHRIKIPTLGWVKLKEKGYIPTVKQKLYIRSGTVSYKADKYYISVIVDIPQQNKCFANYNQGIGIDVGLKDFAICSNGKIYKNINKSNNIKRIEKNLKRQQKKLSKKYLKYKKGECIQNIYKQKLKVQKLYQRLNNIRTDYIGKIVSEVVKQKPSFVTLEDLNIKSMMKNRYLSKAIQEQKFYDFRVKLQNKCHEYGIELKIANRFYPSSKKCNCCGNIKKELKLSDRIYICKICGVIEDRDLNAAFNLRDVKIGEYKSI